MKKEALVDTTVLSVWVFRSHASDASSRSYRSMPMCACIVISLYLGAFCCLSLLLFFFALVKFGVFVPFHHDIKMEWSQTKAAKSCRLHRIVNEMSEGPIENLSQFATVIMSLRPEMRKIPFLYAHAAAANKCWPVISDHDVINVVNEC